MENILLIAVALILVALNGVFVAAEFSLVKLRQTRIRAIVKKHGLAGRILAKVHAQLDAYLSACQLGITLASLGLGWIGEPAFASLLEPLFRLAGIISPEVIHSISFAFAFFVISFLHIVIGELVPKSMAIRNPDKIGLWSAPPLYGFYWLMYPAIWVLNASANWVLRLAGLDNTHAHDAHYSAEELKLILRTSRPAGKFSHDEWNVLAQTLDFSELEVSDLMRPFHEVAALERLKSVQENMQTVARSRFSRYPYLDGTQALGIIHLKDLFLAQQEGKSIDNWSDHLRPVQQVAPRMPALELFRRFRSGAPHFVIVGEKGEKPLGFLTLDNLLGALVGEIRDEFRQNDNDWTRLDDGTLIGKGSLPIYSLERILGIDIENEDFDLQDTASVGGLIMVKLGDIPKEGQRIAFAQFGIVVKKMNGPYIVLVQVYPAGLTAQ
ncbi:MAG: hemolysin family protein [Oxalobacteraceae bacterium]|nr:hemolysin family protein [Oxalobacteraceae bacterium]